MDQQDAGISSMPVSLTMEVLSIWGDTFKQLLKKVSSHEELYLLGEFVLATFIIEQITKMPQEQCQKVIKSTPFFQNAYKDIFRDEEEEQDLLAAFQPALKTTLQIVNRAGTRTLPITFLGSFFERFGIFGEVKENRSPRNATGSFYTPVAIAQFIVDKTLEMGNFSDAIEKIQCLDPACGGGVFLLALAGNLLRREMEGTTRNAKTKIECIRNILTQQIWGMDLSPNAQRVSQVQLILWGFSLVPDVRLGDLSSWVVHCTQGDFLSNKCEGMTKFFVIVGNPPFGNLLSDAQKEAAKKWATTRTGEISELFLERALGILDVGGCLGFVMPKTMAYYAQWARARALLLPAKLTGVMDLGLSFPGVNFETLALFAKKTAGVVEDHLPIFSVNRGEIGTFPRQYIRETDLIPLQPLAPDETTFLEIIRNNSVPVSSVVQTHQVTRGIYLPEEVKGNCKVGNYLWINRVPDIQHSAIRCLWAVDPGVFSLANPHRLKVLQCPKVLLKVLRGRKLSSFPDPWGILVPTEKLVSILLDKCSPQEILAWNACLNSWAASYYLQKVIFSGTTESARVLDYPYLKYIPVLLPKSQSLNVLSGVHLALLLAAQIYAQVPTLISPKTVSAIGIFFQQVAYLAYKGEVIRDSQISLEGEFVTDLQLLRDLLTIGAKIPPIGGLSRKNLTSLSQTQESSQKIEQDFAPPIRDFVHKLEMILAGPIAHRIDVIVERSPQWNKLVQYFNSKF